MQRGNKAFPSYEIEIGGDKIKITCDWKTIYNFEKSNGRSVTALVKSDFQSISTAVDFLFAAIAHQDARKYTKEWICENMSKGLWLHLGGEVIPSAIHAAMLDFEQVEEAKNGQPVSPDSSKSNV